MNMQISSSKMQIMKPFVSKAGIPLAVITLAGFMVAKIATRLSSRNVQQSDSCEILGDDHHEEERSELQEVILGLKCKIEDLQNREWRLENRFLHYQDSKEQEIALMELHNKFMLEINRVEFLERDIFTLLEAEKQRFDSIVREYLVILRLLDFSRTENKQLRKKVLREKGLLIESKETEISKSKTELEEKDDCIRLMGNEIRELKQENELLLREKNELSDKSEVEGGMTNIEDDNIQLVCELDRLQKDEVAEVDELIYLRWRNACLRHELVMRNQEQYQNKKNERDFGEIVDIEEFMSDHELSICHAGQSDSKLGLMAQNHHSKRRKLIEKFKRIWVEKEKHGKNKTSV